MSPPPQATGPIVVTVVVATTVAAAYSPRGAVLAHHVGMKYDPRYEGISWIHGAHTEDSQEGQALLAAYFLSNGERVTR